jgi:TolA-binding protein
MKHSLMLTHSLLLALVVPALLGAQQQQSDSALGAIAPQPAAPQAAPPPADTQSTVPHPDTSATSAVPQLDTSAVPAPEPDTTTVPTDTIFLRAQRMVAEGQGDAGRALVQAQLDSAPVGSPRYVEALYWRAVVAATAADAERDLRKIIIEYPLAPRSADALMRLAQLEMTRGDNDQALTHLERVVMEHPDSPVRARASFWEARVLFEKGNTAKACARLADAARGTPASQVELHNQIDYLNQRCYGVDTTAVASAGAPRESTSVSAGTGAGTGAAARDSSRDSSWAAGAATKPGAAATKPKPTAPAAPAAPSTPATKGAGRYTVQVAAYKTKDAAERLRASLKARGYDARVVGKAAPYRVRVGRYDTREAAAAEVRRMKEKKINGFVTEAEAP